MCNVTSTQLALMVNDNKVGEAVQLINAQPTAHATFLTAATLDLLVNPRRAEFVIELGQVHQEVRLYGVSTYLETAAIVYGDNSGLLNPTGLRVNLNI